MKLKALKIHPEDNVAVALKDLERNEEVVIGDQKIAIQEAISSKHKFALQEFNTGDTIAMYGVTVGKATEVIAQGGAVTIDNIKHATSSIQGKKDATSWEAPEISEFQEMTFEGYHRTDGSVGTRNIWLVIPLVFCENRNIKVMQESMLEQLGYTSHRSYRVATESLINAYQNGAQAEDLLSKNIIVEGAEIKKHRVFNNVDGIKFLTHQGGCGGTREDSTTLCRLFAGYINNPNVAGATVLSLGCQNAQAKELMESLKSIAPNNDKPVFVLEQQASTSERDFIQEAVKQTFVGLIEANKIERRPSPLFKLTLGLECGGSDGFSGITANPVLGYASDLLVALGGKTILAEFPELNGVEQELIDRCIHEGDADKFSQLMESYNERAEAVGSGFAFNPSPGNIKDGLITDAIKSAGAAKKGGTSPVRAVLDYAEQATTPGLSLLCTPGNDVESTTGLAGSGANMIVFTTGLGTPTGNPVAPTIKCSSNTKLYEQMNDIIDFNTGTIIEGEATIESKGRALLRLIAESASGKYLTKAELLSQDDFIPWKRGIAL